MEGNWVAVVWTFGMYVVIPFIMLTAIGVVSLSIAQQRGRVQAKRFELQARLLERIGSAQEFGEFLSTDAGQRFLEAIAPTEPPRNRIWNTIRFGLMAIIGSLVILLARFFNWLDVEHAREGLDVVGFVALATGIAMLGSAAVSHYAARRLGIDIPPEDRLSPR